MIITGSENDIRVGHGSLKLPMLFGQFYTIYGGPYPVRPMRMVGVKLDPKQHVPYDIALDIDDFKTPDMAETLEVVHEIAKEIVAGNPVYIGCMGGWGRTGTIMACVAKAFGDTTPIARTRAEYQSRAIENYAQEDFVRDFEPLGKTLRLIRIYRIMALLSGRKDLTRSMAR